MSFMIDRPQYIIRKSQASDCAELAKIMRPMDVKELKLSHGSSPLQALEESFEHSKISFSLVDKKTNRVQTMSGVGIFPAPKIGIAWLLSSDYIEAVKHSFLRDCFLLNKFMMEGHEMLFNWVYDENLTSMNWLKWLGYQPIKHEAEFGPKKSPFTNMAKFRSSEDEKLYRNFSQNKTYWEDYDEKNWHKYFA